VSALVYQRKDFKVFSVVTVDDQEMNYLGLFGVWIPVPTFEALRRMIRSGASQ
jgi:hypothetical protein